MTDTNTTPPAAPDAGAHDAPAAHAAGAGQPRSKPFVERRNSTKDELIWRVILAVLHMIGNLFRKKAPK